MMHTEICNAQGDQYKPRARSKPEKKTNRSLPETKTVCKSQPSSTSTTAPPTTDLVSIPDSIKFHYSPSQSQIELTPKQNNCNNKLLKPSTTSITSTIPIRNLTPTNSIFFKIRTTAPEKFQVVPTFGIIPGSSTTQVKIKVNPGTLFHTLCYEKFQVLCIAAPPKLLDNTELTQQLQEAQDRGCAIGNALADTLNLIWSQNAERYGAHHHRVETHQVCCCVDPKVLLHTNSEYTFGPISSQNERWRHKPKEEDHVSAVGQTTKPNAVHALINRSKGRGGQGIEDKAAKSKEPFKSNNIIAKLEACASRMEQKLTQVKSWTKVFGVVAASTILILWIGLMVRGFPGSSGHSCSGCGLKGSDCSTGKTQVIM